MAFFDTLTSFFGRSNSDTVTAPATHTLAKMPEAMNAGSGSKKSIRHTLRHQYRYKTELAMDALRSAIDVAEFVEQPDRKPLYAIYRSVELDDQVAAQMLVAHCTVANSSFQVLNKDVENAEAKRYFQRPWFHEYLEYCVDTEMWGHTLLEFDTVMRDDEFQRIMLISRDHVRPDYVDVVASPYDMEGVDYTDYKKYPFLLEIGNRRNLGLYRIVATPATRKKYADSDWSIYSEKFGMPLTTIKTQTTQKNELDSIEEQARKMGSNGYLILDDMDEVEVKVQTGTSGHLNYLDRITLADAQISKVINGQTGTADNQAWSGTADAHSRILNEIIKSRLTKIQYHINEQLIPLLVRHGYPLGESRFQFMELLPPMKRVDDPDNPDDDGVTDAKDMKSTKEGIKSAKAEKKKP